jgi:hypothetical protein
MPHWLAIAAADAIVADFTAATFSQPISPVRKYEPKFTLTELKTARVTVVPKDAPRRRTSRSQFERDVLVDIALQKALAATNDTDEQAETDALSDLAEELLSYYEERMVSGTGLTMFEGNYVVMWEPEHLIEKKVFSSVMTLTLRKWS